MVTRWGGKKPCGSGGEEKEKEDEGKKMVQPVTTNAFLQPAKTSSMCTACHDHALPLNSVNLKLDGIIEPLLKIVNVLRMRPGLGVVHSDQLARHGYGRVHSVGAFVALGKVSKKVLCT